MRLTVRAGEVREGDRLIVLDDNGSERAIEVPLRYPTSCMSGLARWLAPGVLRGRDEPITVERPDPPITITVELTREEAEAYFDQCKVYPLPHNALGRAEAKVLGVFAAALSDSAAIVAARAGEAR